MKIFNSESEARDSLNKKDTVYINSLCPFDKNGKLCGNHCALFYYDKRTLNTSAYVILGCKGTDKKLYV